MERLRAVGGLRKERVQAVPLRGSIIFITTAGIPLIKPENCSDKPSHLYIAGGPKGDALKKEIEAGKYPGIVKTTLDGFDQRDYLEGKSDKSARDVFFYFSGATPSAVRYKNWKMYYTMSQPGATGWILPLVPFHFTLVQNIKRDPFEQAVGESQKTVMGLGGALAAPMTAFIYDWNMLPIGQLLWEKELESYKAGARDLQSEWDLGRNEESRSPKRLAG